MGMKKFILLSLFLGIAVLAGAQNTRDVVAPKAPAVQYQSQKKADRHFLFFGKKKKKTEVEAFRENLSKVYKQKKKEAKLAEKPQYSDPLYFGHKKPPKKRPIGKRKFCKECGLVH